MIRLDKITSIRLFAGDNERLEIVARQEGLDRADILRKAVKDYLAVYYNNHPFLPSNLEELEIEAVFS